MDSSPLHSCNVLLHSSMTHATARHKDVLICLHCKAVLHSVSCLKRLDQQLKLVGQNCNLCMAANGLYAGYVCNSVTSMTTWNHRPSALRCIASPWTAACDSSGHGCPSEHTYPVLHASPPQIYPSWLGAPNVKPCRKCPMLVQPASTSSPPATGKHCMSLLRPCKQFRVFLRMWAA